MKKYMILLLAAAFAFNSCNFLEVPLESSVATSNYFNNIEEFDMVLTGVYNAFKDTDTYDNRRYGNYFQGMMVITRVGTDEMIVKHDPGHGEYELSNYTYTASNQTISRCWYTMYMVGQRACVLIDRLAASSLEDSEAKRRIEGEARFLRAFAYFHLVRLYGEVPIIDHEVSDVGMVSLERRSINDVYDFVLSDLTKAVDLIPEETEIGHVNKDAARAMLGTVYLQMAGKPLEDNSKAALAKEMFAQVINGGRHALVTDWLGLFDGKHEHGPEYIWDIEFVNLGSTGYGGQVGTMDGISTPFSGYWSRCQTSREFYESFDPEDQRREAIARYSYVEDENKELVKEYYEDYDTEFDSHFYAYKFRHGLTQAERGAGWANWSNPINYPIIRYADVLLMYAEADMRANGQAGNDALEYVNQVRRRGFGVDIHTPDSKVDLKSLTYENLLAERSFELCFEGHRWYDLVRFGELGNAMKKYHYDSSLDHIDPSVFNEKHLFYPVPQDVIDASNGAIQQNRGWL